MGDNVVIKPLGLVLIVTAHMVFNGHIRAEVVGILGTDVTLQFTFENITQTDFSHVVLYGPKQNKIKECLTTSECLSVFVLNPGNRSISYHIRNLSHNHSHDYYAILVLQGDNLPFKESNRVQLVVREENQSSTVPPGPTLSTTKEGSGSSSSVSPHLVIVLAVSPVLLLVAMLPWLIWSLVRTKDTQQQQQQTTTTTTQESNETCHPAPASSLIYSVLDFPKRPQTVTTVNPTDTEYADVSCLPEKTRV
ncbi:uncharacterized protein LOC115418242 [Sphaeramia orbicularis]|uniref:uncharacterized protein LOC115418242 n=1 Tax=Sphaeramia orbicularis TaxID=375764 RepID=UPI00117DBB36|nr:uncharacterized protein LOC115418242 [Sphaeramia orbicularis]